MDNKFNLFTSFNDAIKSISDLSDKDEISSKAFGFNKNVVASEQASRDAILSAIEDHDIAVDLSYEKDLLMLNHKYELHFYNPLKQLRNIVLICDSDKNKTFSLKTFMDKLESSNFMLKNSHCFEGLMRRCESFLIDIEVAKSVQILLDRLIKIKKRKKLNALCRHLYNKLKLQTSCKSNVGYDINLLMKIENELKRATSRIDKKQNHQVPIPSCGRIRKTPIEKSKKRRFRVDFMKTIDRRSSFTSKNILKTAALLVSGALKEQKSLKKLMSWESVSSIKYDTSSDTLAKKSELELQKVSVSNVVLPTYAETFKRNQPSTSSISSESSSSLSSVSSKKSAVPAEHSTDDEFVNIKDVSKEYKKRSVKRKTTSEPDCEISLLQKRLKKENKPSRKRLNSSSSDNSVDCKRYCTQQIGNNELSEKGSPLQNQTDDEKSIQIFQKLE